MLAGFSPCQLRLNGPHSRASVQSKPKHVSRANPNLNDADVSRRFLDNSTATARMNYARLFAPTALALSLAFAVVACEDSKAPFGLQESVSGSQPPANAQADGLLALFGKDTIFLGESIEVGDVAFRYHAAGGNAYCFVFVDELTAILEDDYIDPDSVDPSELLIGDPNNTFVLRVIDDLQADVLGLSLELVVNGIEANYACNLQGTPGKDCRQITVDRIARSLTLNSVLMEPTSGAGSEKLRIDGLLTWTTGGE